MKALFALTLSLLALVASSASAGADSSGRVCTVSGACATLTAQLVSSSRPYSGNWTDAKLPQQGLSTGQLQLAVRVQWDEVNPDASDSADMAALISALPLTLHDNSSTSAVSAELEQAGPYPVVCMPSCDLTPGNFYSFFQLSAPIDVTSNLAASKGQHTFSVSIGDGNVDTNSITMAAQAASGGTSSKDGPSQVCDSNGLCGSATLTLDTPDAPSLYAPSGLVQGTVGLYATVTFDTPGFVSQSEVKSSDMFSNRRLLLHVGSNSYPLQVKLALGPLPSNANDMWCVVGSGSKCQTPTRYFAVWVLKTPIRLAQYVQKNGSAKVSFSTVADNGSTISSQTVDFTGDPQVSPSAITLTQLAPRTIKVTLKSGQLSESTHTGKLTFNASKWDGTNWLSFKMTTKLVTVHPGVRSVSAIFHLPVSGRWCFSELGAIVYGGRPHVVYAPPKYLTVH